MDKRGLFQLRPTYDYLRTSWEDEWFSVRRTGFRVLPADAMTVYAAQGSTFEAVIADMQRPPNFDAAKHWLACYVMLSRAKTLEGFLVLRPATRQELSAKPPQYLLDELARLEVRGSRAQDPRQTRYLSGQLTSRRSRQPSHGSILQGLKKLH